MELIENRTFDEERALYALHDATVINCAFEGVADGESAFKEASGITVKDCTFRLRYPFWHTRDFSVENSFFVGTARAALWYASNGVVADCNLKGVKYLRECDGIKVTGCRVISPEFGWRCRNIDISDCDITSEYFLFESRDVTLKNVELSGKYSFQYTEGLTVENCVLNTKDAFWHTKNTVVKDSVINGEYLAWYSDGLTLINCKISGTQPFCYCKNLKLINCTMDNADLAFEYSDVEADINGNIISVKNPLSGHITADSIGELILAESVKECRCEIKTLK